MEDRRSSQSFSQLTRRNFCQIVVGFCSIPVFYCFGRSATHVGRKIIMNKIAPIESDYVIVNGWMLRSDDLIN